MVRVKRGNVAKTRRKKILKFAKVLKELILDYLELRMAK